MSSRTSGMMRFTNQALGIGLLPSSPTLRQGMDARAGKLFKFELPGIEPLTKAKRPMLSISALQPCRWLPPDVDTFSLDNSSTAREGVGHTGHGRRNKLNSSLGCSNIKTHR